MASIKDFIEARKEYKRQILDLWRIYLEAANNPIITSKPIKEIKADQILEEMTQDYNMSLLEGEEAMTVEEMRGIMEEKVGLEKKYTDYDIMQKDDEIALLTLQRNHMESEVAHLKAALSQVVYDRDMSKRYGVDWKLAREGKNSGKTRKRKI